MSDYNLTLTVNAPSGHAHVTILNGNIKNGSVSIPSSGKAEIGIFGYPDDTILYFGKTSGAEVAFVAEDDGSDITIRIVTKEVDTGTITVNGKTHVLQSNGEKDLTDLD